MTAIECTNLTKRYGDVTALDGLELTVERGEVFGFLGPNGAGKTTTIDLMLDFIRPTAGSARILGYDAQSEADAVRDRIGILPDGFDLWPRATGYRHLAFALDSTGGEASPDALIERVGLSPADAERRVGEYSRGMTQRLALAMALAGAPEVLILDEPSSGLDPHGIRTMQTLVRDAAAAGTTVFFSSHILGQVAAVCDRVGILDEGELVTVDSIDGLRETAAVASRLVVERAGGQPPELTTIDGVTDVTVDGTTIDVAYTDPVAKARVIHRLVEAGVDVLDFTTEEATLEDLFTAFTADGSGQDRGEDPETAPVEVAR